MNFTPYITHARNDKEPFETYYMEPQYDARDFEGRVVEVTKTVKNCLGNLGTTIELIQMQLVMKFVHMKMVLT